MINLIMASTSRFGTSSEQEINACIEKTIPQNTKKCHTSVWAQFLVFCEDKGYKLDDSLPTHQINIILKDWAFNMRRKDGEDYKESCIKTMWNTTAKLIQDMYFKNFGRSFNPFSDYLFKGARDARDSKRKELQFRLDKRKESSIALTDEEYTKMIRIWDEDTPFNLQLKFYQIVARELAWRGGEGANCVVKHFKEESDHSGNPTGRIEYNPIFSKTSQGGANRLTDSKWLIPNEDLSLCPVRLYKKILSKRTTKITTSRLFLTPNPYWNSKTSSCWYKNCPVGQNEMFKWTKLSAEKSGMDVKRVKITNHSARSSAVSALAKAGVGEQQLIKITGHSAASSISPYLQMDVEHHSNLIKRLRTNAQPILEQTSTSPSLASHMGQGVINNYHNCNFYINDSKNS